MQNCKRFVLPGLSGVGWWTRSISKLFRQDHLRQEHPEPCPDCTIMSIRSKLMSSGNTARYFFSPLSSRDRFLQQGYDYFLYHFLFHFLFHFLSLWSAPLLHCCSRNRKFSFFRESWGAGSGHGPNLGSVKDRAPGNIWRVSGESVCMAKTSAHRTQDSGFTTRNGWTL